MRTRCLPVFRNRRRTRRSGRRTSPSTCTDRASTATCSNSSGAALRTVFEALGAPLGCAQETLTEKHGTVALPGGPLDGTLYALAVIRLVGAVIRIEVLLVDHQLEHFGLVRVGGEFFQARHDVVERHGVHDHVMAHEENVFTRVLPVIVT